MMVGPRRPTLLETGTRADGDSKSEFSAGTTREPLHKPRTPHPALRATLSRWERDGVARAFSLWEKVPEGRMRGGTYVSLDLGFDPSSPRALSSASPRLRVRNRSQAENERNAISRLRLRLRVFA